MLKRYLSFFFLFFAVGCIPDYIQIKDISKVEMLIRGIDTTKNASEQRITFIDKVEITDTNIIKQIINYRKWKNSENYYCVRNASIIIIKKDNSIDTLDVVTYVSCNLLEYHQNNKVHYKLIPIDIINNLQAIIDTIKIESGCKKL